MTKAKAPQTARDVAVAIILEEFEPQMQKLQAVGETFSQMQDSQRLIHEEFDSDMNKLGQQVGAVQESAAELGRLARAITSGGKQLESTLARMETLAAQAPPARAGVKPAARPAPAGPGKAAPILLILLVLALAWAGFMTWQHMANRNTLAVGTATLKAWPSLSESAKATIKGRSQP